MTRLWTIVGILALALVMTPEFLPLSSSSQSRMSQTVTDLPKESKKAPSVLNRVLKFVQARRDEAHPRKRLKHM